MGSIIQRYEKELTDSVIPFWENHCVDRDHGGFLICLDRSGEPYDTTKHLWYRADGGAPGPVDESSPSLESHLHRHPST